MNTAAGECSSAAVPIKPLGRQHQPRLGSGREAGVSQSLKMPFLLRIHLVPREGERVGQCSARSVEADTEEFRALQLVSRIHRPGRDGM